MRFDPAPAGLGHVPQLDGIRTLAIGIVMVSHAGFGSIIPGGFGVTLFFFLSGFLITTLLRQEGARSGRIDLPAFYLRRTIRIVPPMALTIVFSSFLGLAGLGSTAPAWSEVVTDLGFLTNYAPLVGIDSTSPIPLWSLDVEEHFYILFATLFAGVLVGLKSERAAKVCVLLCIAALLARIAHWQAGTPLWQIYYWSHTRIDSILFGCVLALWQNPLIDRVAWRPRLWAVASALAVVLATFVIRDPAFRETIRYTLQGGALFVLFSAALHDRGLLLRLLGSAPLRFVALISYTLYLVHLPLLRAAEDLNLPLAPMFGYALAVGYAMAMRRWIELPLGRWRHRVENARRNRRQLAGGPLPVKSDMGD